MSAPISIPRSIGEVTAEWLTRALQQSYPGIAVTSAELLDNMGGACTKLRLSVETSFPDFPETLVVKGCFEPHSMDMLPIQYREAILYSRILPQLKGIETIKCYFIQADEAMGSAIVMEDLNLRGVICRTALDTMPTYERAADYLAALARIHAHWWNSTDLLDKSRFGFLPASLEAQIPRTEAILSDPELFALEIRKPRAVCLPRSILDRERLLRSFNATMALSRDMPFTMLHGDTHPSNLYNTCDGQPGFLDWTSWRGPWAHEVAYFIAGNLDPADRRTWEKPLLQFYLSQLSALGVAAPRFEEAWFAYRIWMMWGIYVWLFNIPEFHSEASITAMSSRYGTALADHGTLDILDHAMGR